MVTVVKEKDGYRIRKYYDDSCAIEKYRDGRWRLCFGLDSISEGFKFLENPAEIESQIKRYKLTGWVVLFVIGLLTLNLFII